jgi:ABC-type transporter MlaC component
MLGRGRLFSIAALAILAGGCATTDSVKHAQETADQALSAAQAAQKSSDQNRTDINTLSQRVDQLDQEMQAHKRHGGERG